MKTRINPRLAKIIFAAIAFVGYGGWALYSNIMDGSEASMIIAWRAACIQGVYSAIVTLVNMLMLEFSFSRYFFEHPPTLARAYSVATVLLLQYSMIVPVHILNGTPNIFITLLPGMIIGTAFSYAYITAYSQARDEAVAEKS